MDLPQREDIQHKGQTKDSAKDIDHIIANVAHAANAVLRDKSNITWPPKIASGPGFGVKPDGPPRRKQTAHNRKVPVNSVTKQSTQLSQAKGGSKMMKSAISTNVDPSGKFNYPEETVEVILFQLIQP